MGLERSSFSPELVPAGTDRVLQILCKKNTIAWVSTYMIQKISGSIYYVPRVVAFPNCFFGIWCWVFVYLWGILLLFFLVLLLLCWGVGVFCFGVCVRVCLFYLPAQLAQDTVFSCSGHAVCWQCRFMLFGQCQDTAPSSRALCAPVPQPPLPLHYSCG